MNWPVHPVNPSVQVRVVRPMPELSPAVEARVAAHWAASCARHGLFNGTIFSVDGITPDLITGHWTEYRRSLAQMREPALRDELGVRNLAVCGVIEGPDGVLLGRRAASAVYQPGMWQLPPAGSVDRSAATADGADLRHALLTELQEELGIGPGDVRGFRPLCLVEHPDSGVTDLGIALRTDLTLLQLRRAHRMSGNAEYDQLIAGPAGGLEASVGAQRGEMVPPARAFLARLPGAS